MKESDSEGEGEDGAELPDYAAMLFARHEAHRSELQQILSEHWGGRTLEVLDVACGDGFYAAELQKLVGTGSRIVAVDVSEAFLDVAERQAESQQNPGRLQDAVQIEFLKARAEHLPFPDGCFDLVWCAQSLISLPDVPAALQEMRRVVRPGGQVGILENDPLHEIQLPWPVDLEIAVRAADRQRSAATSKTPDSGRRLNDLLRKAGLRPLSRKTLAIDRLSPLSPADTRFLKLYLEELSHRLTGWLPDDRAQEFRESAKRLTASAGDDSGAFWMTWNDTIVISTPV